jgi:hypothetical protein
VTVVTAKIQVRRGTAAEWAAANPVLAEGEMSYETDTGFTKLGDGATEYADLPAYATYDQMVAAMAEIDETLDEAEAQVVLASGHRANAESARDVAIAAQNIATQQATIATSQASLAEGHAASAASVVQQDLSGVTAQALHRSNNAITSMFIYDTSKDSDGGAWTEKCQHTSWWNEPIMGKWLGAQSSELQARNSGAALGAELVVNGNFDTDVSGWQVAGCTVSKSGNAMRITDSDGAAGYAFRNVSLEIGKTYLASVEVTLDAITGSLSLYMGTSSGSAQMGSSILANGPGTISFFFTATATTGWIAIRHITAIAGEYWEVDNVSVREVTALTTASGDYFQLSTDGKFYRLWQNHMTQSRLSAAGIGFSTGVSVTSDATLDVTGAPAQKLVVDSAGGATQFFAFFSSTQMPTLTANTNYVFSVEVKKGTLRYAGFTLDLFTGIPNGTHLRYDLDTGLVDFASPQYLSHGILNLGNGWYRIWGLVNTGTSIGGSRQFRVLADSDTNASDSSYSVPRDGEASHYVGRCQIDFAQLGPVEEKSGIGTISEVFRGNKRDFPRLAGIVAEASNVTIYDLTESGRPMWMRFDRRSTATWVSAYFGGNSSANVSSVSALNGLLVFSLLGGFGLRGVFFPADNGWSVSNNAGNDRLWNDFSTPISGRNGDITRHLRSPSAFIAGADANAVAMTVLPDAPVDPVTGLRVPTIAVATNGGVSVIKHNGTVVNITSGAGGSSILAFLENGSIFSSSDTSSVPQFQSTFLVNKIPAVSLETGTFNNPTGSSEYYAGRNRGTPDIRLGADIYLKGGVVAVTRNKTVLLANHANGYGTGLGVYGLTRKPSIKSGGLVKNITNTFNTGWVTGDVRRCFLSDTEAGSITGPELVANGTFDTDISGWTQNAGGSAVWDASGAIACSDVAGADCNVSAPITTVVGRQYRVSWTVQSSNGSWLVRIRNSTDFQYVAGGTGSFSGVFTSSAVSNTVNLLAADTNSTTVFDNISVREVVADRSYKAQGALITGTLTRAQLASGTSLVGYSGFSAANYLQEPFSADLEFGTGEWTGTAWVNIPATLTDASFGATPVPVALDTAEWSKGTGWSAPSAGSFSCDGSQTGATDLSWVSGNRLTSNSGVVKRWTVTVTAISGMLMVYANNGSPGAITAPGTYYFYSNPTNGTELIAILRMAGAGQTCTGTLAMDDLSPSRIVERSHTSGPSFRLAINRYGQLTATVSDGTTARTVTTPATYNIAQWLKARVNYTTDGTLAILVNGREVAASRGAPLLTLNNASAVLTIGNSYALDAPFPGSIALLKLGATVPTPEQSVFMYEQEKQLFRAGAQSVLPDSGSIVDMAYDDATDRWVAVSAANESYWTGLVRNSVTPVPAGSFTRIAAASGIELAARSTTNPGVDVTIPAYGLREELVRRAEAASKLSKDLAVYDYVGGFTASTTNGSTAITSVAGLTYPASYIGARISGSGIPANTTIVAVSGTTIYLSAAATATATGVSISFLDFRLPVGMEAKAVMSAGALRQEGATKDFVKLWDGFIETVRFGVAPGATAWVQIQATRGTMQ